MPNRIIKESINESRNLCGCSVFAQDLYKRLLTYADDYGRFNCDMTIIFARLYPREMDVVTINIIDGAFSELVCAGKIGVYRCKAHKDDLFGAFPNWSEHQRVRESKKKCPDPEEMVNDWYLKRFIPIETKIKLLEDSGGKCMICGKYLYSPGVSARAAIKLQTGAFHFDHIVPVQQGGRATLENIRVVCPKCNLSRKKILSFDEILAETMNSPQVAASFSESPPNPIQSNPIRIQSESNPNPIRIQSPKSVKTLAPDNFNAFWSVYPKKVGKKDALKAWQKLKPDDALTKTIVGGVRKWQASKQWAEDGGRFIPHPATFINGERWNDECEPAKQVYVPKNYDTGGDFFDDDDSGGDFI